MALKVCQLCAVDFTVKHFLLPLIDGMAAAGWEVTTVCSDGDFVPALRRQGYGITPVPIARSLNILSHLRSLWRLYRLFRKERFDLLHAHTPIAALIARLAGRLAGVPLIVYTAHGFYFHDQMPRWKRRLFISLEKLAGRYTQLLFTQSAEDAATAVAEGICPHGRVLAIGNGVDPARFDPASAPPSVEVRRQLGIPADAPVIGIIGRMVREKGYGEFLEAAAMLAEEFPHVHFLQVGGRLASDHNASIDDVIARTRATLGPRLVLAGFRPDTPAMLAAMDIFCLPSWREGMPRTIIEAMMMGKAVVATDIRGAREEVVAGETGWIVPAKDATALAAAWRKCLEDPAGTALMGARGRQRALQLYDEKNIVDLQLRAIRAGLAGAA